MDVSAYEHLLKTTRIRPSTKGDRPSVVQTGSDRGRIVFSSAFRRLQQKAQVFPLDSNAAVRTRLTHSLEVAHTGRYLAQEILYRLRENTPQYSGTWLSAHEQVFADIVEAACLIHDIGNPPFGHFGEAAIRDWFAVRGKSRFREYASRNQVSEKSADPYLASEFLDFIAFDGNPQGLRLVTKLQGEDGKTGLNLTFPLLMAYLKYNCLPEACKLAREDAKSSKPGYFSTEASLIKKACQELRMDRLSRHPLSYVMEAADDISFCMSDIEDGIEKRIVSAEEVFDFIIDDWKSRCETRKELDKTYVSELVKTSKNNYALKAFTAFKTEVINRAVRHAADIYRDAHDQILSGQHTGLIRDESNIFHLLKSLRVFVQRTIFRSPEAENVELAGYSTIRGLLDHFSYLLLLRGDVFKELLNGERVKGEDYSLRLINKLSPKSRASYENESKSTTDIVREWHLRAHLIVDHVSGMTDHFAVKTHQLLDGIRITT